MSNRRGAPRQEDAMFDQMKYPRESGTSSSSSDRRRSVAWILFLIVDVGFVLWGAGAAWAPDGLVGPGGKAILPAAFEGFSGGSWSALVSTSPLTASYMILLYRTYGFYNVAFGLTTVAITVTACDVVSSSQPSSGTTAAGLLSTGALTDRSHVCRWV